MIISSVTNALIYKTGQPGKEAAPVTQAFRQTTAGRKKLAEITDKIYENRIQHPNLAHAPGLSGAYMAGQNRRIFSERGGVLLPPSETA